MADLTHPCPVCEEPFKPGPPGWTYCGDKCRSRAKRRRAAGLPIADADQPVVECEVCGGGFVPAAGRQTCSEQCAQRRRWRRKHGLPISNAEQGPKRFEAKYPGVCEHCGDTFVAKRANTRFCSETCSRRAGTAVKTAPARRRRSRSKGLTGKQRAYVLLDEWLSRVDRSSDGCHLWPEGAPVSSHGYPVSTQHEVEGEVYVHRILHIREHGPIPAGWEPDHVCRVKLCVRPDHHELVTHAENLRRAVPYRRAQVDRLGPCPHDDSDVYWDPTGKRVCRICRRERVRLWREDRRAEGIRV